MAVAIRERFVGDQRGVAAARPRPPGRDGIATGYATMGRIGFEGRYDYGGIGNAIILASRLEQRGEGRRDPHRPADVRSGRRRPIAGGARRRAPAQGVQPADAGLPRDPTAGAVRASGRDRSSALAARGVRRRLPTDRRATFANLLEMTGGDQAFVDELVDTYLEEGDRLVERAHRRRDRRRRSTTMVRPAHSLKSSSLNVGALELGAAVPGARGGRPEAAPSIDPVGRANAVKLVLADDRGAGAARGAAPAVGAQLSPPRRD